VTIFLCFENIFKQAFLPFAGHYEQLFRVSGESTIFVDPGQLPCSFCEKAEHGSSKDN
jgi:hypothetical protein